MFISILFITYSKKKHDAGEKMLMDLTSPKSSRHTEHSLERMTNPLQMEGYKVAENNATITIASNLSLAVEDVIDGQRSVTRLSLLPPPVNLIPDRMILSMIELLPDEITVIPVWDSNHTLVAGGKEIGKDTCTYPILDKTGGSGRCCLGARSTGGIQVYQGAEEACPQDLPIYFQIQDFAVQELEAYPVSDHTNWTQTKCDVCRIVHIVASMKHKRIAIVGDSVQRQLFNGLECELRRRNFEVSITDHKLWPRPRENEDWKQRGWKYGMRQQFCFNVTTPYTHNHQNHSLSSYVEICQYDHYRPYLDMVQHAAIASQSDIMMIDYGAHYLPGRKKWRNEFKQSIQSLLKVFDNSECLLMYRETAAQHFDSNGGEYEQWMHEDWKNITCRPIRGTIMKWRTKIFESAAGEGGYSIVDSFQPMQAGAQDKKKEVAFLPFFDYSSKMLSLRDGTDCTHFCYTPHLWYPIWRHMRIAIDKLDTA